MLILNKSSCDDFFKYNRNRYLSCKSTECTIQSQDILKKG